MSFLLRWLLLLRSTGSRWAGFSGYGIWASLSCSTWDLPGPGIEAVFPALAGRFLTTGSPGKPLPIRSNKPFRCFWLTLKFKHCWLRGMVSVLCYVSSKHRLMSRGCWFDEVRSWFSLLALQLSPPDLEARYPGGSESCVADNPQPAPCLPSLCPRPARPRLNCSSSNGNTLQAWTIMNHHEIPGTSCKKEHRLAH